METAPLVPPDAPAWWAALSFALMLAMQLFKTFAKRASWWSAAVARIVALLGGVIATVAVAPSDSWYVDALSGLAVGLASILGYDIMARTDSGVRRIGPVLLACLAAWMALPLAGCGGRFQVERGLEFRDAAVTYETRDAVHRLAARGGGDMELDLGTLELLAFAQGVVNTATTPAQWALLAQLGARFQRQWVLYVEFDVDSTADRFDFCVRFGSAANPRKLCFPMRRADPGENLTIEGEWAAPAEGVEP